MDNTFTVPCQVPQFSKGFVRDKTALEQTGPKQCGDPLSILHVCLTSRNILHVSGVHYQDTDLTVKTGFQHLVNGLPVDSGAFHGNVPAFGFDNPVTQLLHFRDECTEGSYLSFRLGIHCTFDQTGNDDIPMNVQSHGTGQNVLHKIPSCRIAGLGIARVGYPNLATRALHFHGATNCCSLGQFVHVEQTGWHFRQGATGLSLLYPI